MSTTAGSGPPGSPPLEPGSSGSPAAGRPYLVGLRLAGRQVLVVGAGAVAARRVPPLLGAGARVTVVAPHAVAALRSSAEHGVITWVARRFEDRDLDYAWYVLACTDDPEVNARVAGLAEDMRVFCVRADAAEAGTAVTPATATHDGLTIGVLGGGDPRRAAGVRDGLIAALAAGGLDPGPYRAAR